MGGVTAQVRKRGGRLNTREWCGFSLPMLWYFMSRSGGSLCKDWVKVRSSALFLFLCFSLCRPHRILIAKSWTQPPESSRNRGFWTSCRSFFVGRDSLLRSCCCVVDVFCQQFRLFVPCQLENRRFVSFEFLLPPPAAHPLYNYYRTIACSAGLPCFCFTRNFVSFFPVLRGLRFRVCCSFAMWIWQARFPEPRFVSSSSSSSLSAGYLFAIHRSDLHPDDTLETRTGDKRWKRNTHIRRSIQTSVQSVRIILGILSLRLWAWSTTTQYEWSFFGQKLSFPFQQQKERAASGDSCQSILEVTWTEKWRRRLRQRCLRMRLGNATSCRISKNRLNTQYRAFGMLWRSKELLGSRLVVPHAYRRYRSEGTDISLLSWTRSQHGRDWQATWHPENDHHHRRMRSNRVHHLRLLQLLLVVTLSRFLVLDFHPRPWLYSSRRAPSTAPTSSSIRGSSKRPPPRSKTKKKMARRRNCKRRQARQQMLQRIRRRSTLRVPIPTLYFGRCKTISWKE